MTQLNKLSLTSDRDYLKIHDDGQLLISTSGAAESDATFPVDAFAATLSGSQTINHGLGTAPLVRTFWDPNKNGQWWAAHAFPDPSLGLFPFFEVDPFLIPIITSQDLKLIIGTNGSAVTDIPVFYRIYDLGNVAITSDSRIDKIFAKEPGQTATAPAAPDSFDPTFKVITIPHPAGEAPIWTFQFSEDGSNWYNENGKIIGPPDTGSGPPGGPYSVYYYTRAFCYADSRNFYIILENNYASDKTIHYRYTLDYRG